MGTVNILEAARQAGVSKIIIQSTDKIYGNRMEASESDPVAATEPYGTSKACADLAAQCYINTYNLPVAITRCCNVYGYDPHNNRIIPNTIKACLMNQQPVIYTNDKSLRQYIYVDDVIDALIFITKHKLSGKLNIASNTILTQEEVVMNILKFFPNLKPIYTSKPNLVEIKKQSMKSSLKWKAKTPFEKGIELTINKFKEYKDDWCRRNKF
jgi:dTDP-D-glucose 4,6-dehydratase